MNELRDQLTHLYDRDVGLNPIMSADVSKAASAFSDVTGLSFSVESGKNYCIFGGGTWQNSSAFGGLSLGFDHPGGQCRMLVEYTGSTSLTSNFRDWMNGTDSGVGPDTVGTPDTVYAWWIAVGVYNCTSSGTFQMRYSRNGAGTVTVETGSALFVTHD